MVSNPNILFAKQNMRESNFFIHHYLTVYVQYFVVNIKGNIILLRTR